MQEKDIHKRGERGFTLIELLIAIVVVGILAAVAIVGIAGLTNSGSKSACAASADAAKAASAAFYANQSPNVWPSTFEAMGTPTDGTGGTPVNKPVVYEKPANATWSADHMSLVNGSSWTLTMTGGGANPPVFDPHASGNCGTP